MSEPRLETALIGAIVLEDLDLLVNTSPSGSFRAIRVAKPWRSSEPRDQ